MEWNRVVEREHYIPSVPRRSARPEKSWTVVRQVLPTNPLAFPFATLPPYKSLFPRAQLPACSGSSCQANHTGGAEGAPLSHVSRLEHDVDASWTRAQFYNKWLVTGPPRRLFGPEAAALPASTPAWPITP